MGNLFNKEALIEYLLDKKNNPFPHFSHIQQLKDVSEVTLCWNVTKQQQQAAAAAKSSAATLSASSPLSLLPLLDDSHQESVSSSSADAEQEALYSCPITGAPSNGLNRFVVLQPCGCVISERALKSVAAGTGGAGTAAAASNDSCMVCGKDLVRDAPHSPSPVAVVPGADGAAASAAASASAAAASSAATAAPAASSSSSASFSSSSSPRSPFHHPSYITLFPQKEETLYLRAQLAEKLKQRELDKLAKKAAKKAAAASATVTTTAAGAEGDHHLAGHKRKADGESSEARAAKKAQRERPGAHQKLVASTTGNIMADHVRAITAQAAQVVAQRRKESNFDSMFSKPVGAV
jgi:hypothetical protein